MVAKISNGNSLFGALTYNLNKVKEEKAHIICSQKIIRSISNNPDLNLALIMKSFEPYLAMNDRIKKPIVHISLNPDPKDSLSDDDYKKIAEEYLEKMGFKDQPYLVFKHEDIDRHHIHIVTTRVNDKGEKIPDAHEHYRSMRVCRELEKKYNLHPAVGKNKEFGEEFIKKIDYQKGDIKHQISNTLRSLCDTYHFHSFGEYNALLACYNIHAKLVSGERYGEKYNGIVYSATDDKGNIVSTPFKSSLFGKRFGFKGLEKIMKRNTDKLKQSGYPKKIKPVIYHALKGATSKADFISKLENAGISTVFRENEEGRIYGVTFIDHQNRMVVNGSRLGKELSANMFNRIFNQTQSQQTTNISHAHHIPSMFEQALGILDFNMNGYDPEEKKFENEMKKKKRKRKKGRSI